MKRIEGELSFFEKEVGEPLFASVFINDTLDSLRVVYKGDGNYYFVVYVSKLIGQRERYTKVCIPNYGCKSFSGAHANFIDSFDKVIEYLRSRGDNKSIEEMFSSLRDIHVTSTSKVLSKYTRYPATVFHTPIWNIPYDGLVIFRCGCVMHIYDTETNILFKLDDKKYDILSARILDLYLSTGRTSKIKRIMERAKYSYKITIYTTWDFFGVQCESKYLCIIPKLFLDENLREYVQDLSFFRGKQGIDYKDIMSPDTVRLLHLLKRVYYGERVSFEDFYRAIFRNYDELLGLKERIETLFSSLHSILRRTEKRIMLRTL